MSQCDYIDCSALSMQDVCKHIPTDRQTDTQTDTNALVTPAAHMHAE